MNPLFICTHKKPWHLKSCNSESKMHLEPTQKKPLGKIRKIPRDCQKWKQDGFI